MSAIKGPRPMTWKRTSDEQADMAAMLDTRGSLDHHRPSPRSLQLGSMPKLPRELRLCVRL